MGRTQDLRGVRERAGLAPQSSTRSRTWTSLSNARTSTVASRYRQSDRHVEGQEGLLGRLELLALRHASRAVEGEHDVDALGGHFSVDVTDRLVDVLQPREARREERAGYVEVRDLIRLS